MRMERALRRAMAGGRAAQPSRAERSQTGPSVASNPRPRAQRPCAGRRRRPPISAWGRGRGRGPEHIRSSHWVMLSAVRQGVWPERGGRGRALRAAGVPQRPPAVSPRFVPSLCPPAVSPRCVPSVPSLCLLCPLCPLSPRHHPRLQGGAAPACQPGLDQTHTGPLRASPNLGGLQHRSCCSAPQTPTVLLIFNRFFFAVVFKVLHLPAAAHPGTGGISGCLVP